MTAAVAVKKTALPDGGVLPLSYVKSGSEWVHNLHPAFKIMVLGERNNWLEPIILWETVDGERGETRVGALRKNFTQIVCTDPGLDQEAVIEPLDPAFELFLFELMDFSKTYHRLPKERGGSEAETVLYKKLRSKRVAYGGGRMSQRSRHLLDTNCPNWHSTREYDFHARLSVTQVLLTARGRFPKQSEYARGTIEHESARWLDTQRRNLRKNLLRDTHLSLMDVTLPGWRSDFEAQEAA